MVAGCGKSRIHRGGSSVVRHPGRRIDPSEAHRGDGRGESPGWDGAVVRRRGEILAEVCPGMGVNHGIRHHFLRCIPNFEWTSPFRSQFHDRSSTSEAGRNPSPDRLIASRPVSVAGESPDALSHHRTPPARPSSVLPL
jgi:hypothetical protein